MYYCTELYCRMYSRPLCFDEYSRQLCCIPIRVKSISMRMSRPRSAPTCTQPTKRSTKCCTKVGAAGCSLVTTRGASLGGGPVGLLPLCSWLSPRRMAAVRAVSALTMDGVALATATDEEVEVEVEVDASVLVDAATPSMPGSSRSTSSN